MLVACIIQEARNTILLAGPADDQLLPVAGSSCAGKPSLSTVFLRTVTRRVL